MNLRVYLQKVKRAVRWIALYVIGPCFLLVALIASMDTAVFLHRAVATTGTVVGLRATSEPNKHGVTYAPVFSFSAADGRSYTIHSRVSSSPPEFSIGQRVPVLYEPDRPTLAKIDSHLQLWTFPDVFGGIGFVFVLLSYVVRSFERWRDRRRLDGRQLETTPR
jgi:hypothetical protein